jgi:DNA-binding CsgD family transcriptional regulator
LRGAGSLRHSDFTSEGRLLAGVLVAFLAVAVFAAIDIFSDIREGTTVSHVVSESGVLLVGLLGSIFMVRQLVLTLRRARAVEREAVDLEERLAATEAEANRWRSEARDLMNGLAAALDQQFDRWALSPAEKETALLLLKGLSHKEVADVRSVSDATARQQARAVYKKAGLSGRHDLAAFFLEDLMLPIEPEDENNQGAPSSAEV